MRVFVYFAIFCFVENVVDASPKECYACAERDAATCTKNQGIQTCATDRNSLGTTHCASAVGKYRDQYGIVRDGFMRGCVYCADKKAACFSLGGALKAWDFWTVLKCEIECCADDNCNTQAPTLTQSAITVFTPDVAGPKECNACAERDEATCSANQQSQVCATDQNSLGTTHCATAAGKYKDQSGIVQNGFIRGCIDCADKKAACFALGGALKARESWTLLECGIECCTDDDCNNQTTISSEDRISVFTPDGRPTAAGAASRESLSVLISAGVLAVSFALGNILYHF